MASDCFLCLLKQHHAELKAEAQRKQRTEYLADGGQFGEQHLEDGWRQSLLQHLQQLLRLTTHGDGVGQVVHAFLIVSCGHRTSTAPSVIRAQ